MISNKRRKDPPKQQRNAPCACGSGKKYKKCHLLIEREEAIKAAQEWEKQRKARAEARRRELEHLSDMMRERAASPFMSPRMTISPFILTGLAMAAMTSPSIKYSKFK